MKSLVAFYFSGTGNTRYIAERILRNVSAEYTAKLYDVTSDPDVDALSSADVVLLAFPIYGSAPPLPMREFVHRCGSRLKGKKVAIAETQYFFSGDGAASIGRTVEKYGGTVILAEHFNMPNNLADCRIFAIRNGGELGTLLNRAEKRADAFARRLLRGKTRRRGFGILSHAVGYFCQRKYWRKGEKEKRGRLKVDPVRCVGCGACEKRCPVHNLRLEGGKAVPLGKCVLCYRCVNLCPRRAITLIGNEPPEKQYRGIP